MININFLLFTVQLPKPVFDSPLKNDQANTIKDKPDPIMMRVIKDFNSPSVTARIKANKAMKSPSFRRMCYGSISNNVDIPLIDTISEDKENPPPPSPVKVLTTKDIFKNCRIHVEVRSADDDRSAGIRNRLTKEGIQVDLKVNKSTTHVIFKDGLLSTYKQAKAKGIPIVTLLWIDTCINQKRLVDPTKFQISNLDRYEHPELYKKIRGRKSMTPNIEKFHPLCITPDAHSKTTNITVDMNLTYCEGVKSSQMSLVEENEPSTPVNESMAMSISTPKTDFVAPPKPKIVFNSLNRVSSLSRRSLADQALQKITENCNKSMSSIKERDLMSTPKIDSSLRTNLHKKRLFEKIKDDYKENEVQQKKLKNSPKIRSTTKKTDNKKVNGRDSILTYFKVNDKSKKSTSVSSTKLPSPKKKFIVCTNMSMDQKNELHTTITKLGGTIENSVTEQTTHVVSPTIDRTMNILRGVVRACLIMDIQWIKESEKHGKFVDTTLFQHIISDSNKFYERSVLGKNFKNDIFSSIGLFYLDKKSFALGDKMNLYLKEIIELCNGKITENINEASIFVSDSEVKLKEKKIRKVKASHIFDSAMKGKFIDI